MKPVVTLGTFATAVAIVAAIACGTDTVAAPTNAAHTSGGAAGNDSSGGSPGGSQGSPGDSSSHGDSSGSPRFPWLTITPEASSLQRGYYLELHATLHDPNGAPVSAHVDWHSSDDRIATVGDTGLVHGVSLGRAVIFATANGVNDTAIVQVVDSVVPPPPPPPPPVDSGTVPDSTPGSQPPPPPPPPDSGGLDSLVSR